MDTPASFKRTWLSMEIDKIIEDRKKLAARIEVLDKRLEQKKQRLEKLKEQIK